MAMDSEFMFNPGDQYNTPKTLPWQDDALCAQTNPEAFFPEKGGSTREAKKICGQCDVARECLDNALETDERFGIRGGMSERERRALKNLGPQAVTIAFEKAQAKNR